MELQEIIEALKGIEAKPADIADAFKKELNPVYTEMFNAGHRSATGTGREKIEGFEKQIEQLNKSIEAKESQIEQLKKSSPDVAKVQAEYEATLKGKAEEIDNLKNQINEIKADFTGKLNEKDAAFFFSQVQQSLTGEGNKRMKSVFAETILQNQSIRDRVKFGENGPTIYQADGKTPIPYADGMTAAQALANDLRTSLDAELFTDVRPGDHGFGNNGKGGQGGSDVDWSKARKDPAYLEKMLPSVKESV